MFLSNGSSYCYEFLPNYPNGGLFEGATAECRSPFQVLLQQRAQERLIVEALPDAEAELHAYGHHGSLSLLRNARDIEGNTYGPQENYECVAAEPRAQFLYRLGLCLLIPLILVVTLALWSSIAAFVILALVFMLVFTVVDGLLGAFLSSPAPLQTTLEKRGIDWMFIIGWFEIGLQTMIVWPVVVPYAWLVRLCLFRRVRRGLLGFLVSRPIITGTGTLLEDGAFALSEKAPGITGLHRYALALAGHSIFDSGNLLKGILSPALLDLQSFRHLFGSRQRLQLGLSDANRQDVAEYLKVGLTSLLIDMAEAGYLDESPMPVSPVRGLKHISNDPTLQATIDVRHREPMTALELQRWYLERAQGYLERLETHSVEAFELVRLWRTVLDTLDESPDQLFGQLDWVTKRYLLRTAVGDHTMAARKKVDLKYHELGTGYGDRLRNDGLARSLVSPEDVEFAMYEAPENSPAYIRGQVIREWADQDAITWVTWTSVRLREDGKSRIVSLDDYRNREP